MRSLHRSVVVFICVIATLPLTAQETTPIHYEPARGEPIDTTADTAYDPETGELLIVRQEAAPASRFNPKTGEVEYPLTPAARPVLEAIPGPHSTGTGQGLALSSAEVTAAAARHAREDHNYIAAMLGGGFLNIGGSMVGALGGAMLSYSDAGVLGGMAIGSLITVNVLGKTVGPAALPEELKQASPVQKSRYILSYRKTTRRLRVASAYAGTVLIFLVWPFLFDR